MKYLSIILTMFALAFSSLAFATSPDQDFGVADYSAECQVYDDLLDLQNSDLESAYLPVLEYSCCLSPMDQTFGYEIKAEPLDIDYLIQPNLTHLFTETKRSEYLQKRISLTNFIYLDNFCWKQSRRCYFVSNFDADNRPLNHALNGFGLM